MRGKAQPAKDQQDQQQNDQRRHRSPPPCLPGRPPAWTRPTPGAVAQPSVSPDPSVDQVEVRLVVRAVLGLLPPADDPVATVLEPAREALGEGRALAPELPLAVADAHLVDAADAAIVRVELVAGPVGGVAPHDRDSVGSRRQLHRRALDHVGAGVMPLERGPRLARPGFAAGRDRLQRPFADERLELLQGALRGGLIHFSSLAYAAPASVPCWPPKSRFSGTN